MIRSLGKALLADQFRELAFFVLPVVCVGQGCFSLGDTGPTNAGQICIELSHMFLVAGDIFFCVNSIDRTLRNADCAVDTFIGIDGQEVRTLSETIDGADINTIGIFAADTSFSYYVGHNSLKKR